MPARRKSAHELALSGAASINPGRYGGRGEVPTSGTAFGYCPKHLSPSQRDIWKELVSLAPRGLLTASDRMAVELAVRLIERSRAGGQKASEVAVLVTLMARLGMTPSDRQRLQITPQQPDEDDGWGDL